MSVDLAAGRPAAPSPHRAPVFSAAAAILLLSSAAWVALASEAARSAEGIGVIWAALCTATGLTGGGVSGIGDLIAKLGFWVAMTAAMMLPVSAAATVAQAERLGAGPMAVAGSVLMPICYLLAWSVVAVGLGGLQFLLEAALARVVLPERAASVIGGVAIGFAGLYQFSPLKARCLAACRVPPADAEESVAELRSAVAAGLRHARACIGCCSPMMAMMVLAGAMNIFWMAIFAALMTIERFVGGLAAARMIGIGLTAAGLFLSFSAAGPGRIAGILFG
jgi:predicted metal-binding membrane protein